MDELTLTGTREDILFKLYAMKDFYIRLYDIQDDDIKKEFDITLEAIYQKIKELEE